MGYFSKSDRLIFGAFSEIRQIVGWYSGQK